MSNQYYADRANEIELDRDRIMDKWWNADTSLTFMTWLDERDTLKARWNAVPTY